MKIIASDYDGTLRRHKGIEQADREAIKKWRACGNLFGIVTGRDANFITAAIPEDNVELDFVIIYNGVDIYDLSESPKLIKRMSGKTDRLYELLPLILRKSGDWAEFVTPDKNYYLTYHDEPADSKNNWAKNAVLKDVNEFIQIYSLYGSDEESLEIVHRLNDGFSDAVSALANGAWLNAAPLGVTKATGVWEYAKLKSVKKEDIYTIGDSYNDLDMIKAFNGFTVDNGAAVVKQAAQAVYRGIWELIDSLLLK